MFNLFKKSKAKKSFQIAGMHCASCAMVIESEMEDAGINAKCSYAKQTLEVFSDTEVDEKQVKAVLGNAGYKIVYTTEKTQ